MFQFFTQQNWEHQNHFTKLLSVTTYQIANLQTRDIVNALFTNEQLQVIPEASIPKEQEKPVAKPKKPKKPKVIVVKTAKDKLRDKRKREMRALDIPTDEYGHPI